MELGNPPALPPPQGSGWPKRPANARSGGGACVVVRGRESRPHGEGGQWIHLASRRWTLVRHGDFPEGRYHDRGQSSASGDRHPARGHHLAALGQFLLTAIDERYRRWVPNPRDKTRERAQQRLQSDYKRGRPGFYVVQYADDFVVLVQGTQQDADQERLALAQFLKEELRMESSMEKTKITDVRERFDFSAIGSLR